MKIEISSVFKSWYDGNANKAGLLNAIDDMLLNMYVAVTEDDFSAKSSQEGYGNGNVRSIRGSAGTHGAFRMYCSMGHLAAKQPVLRLALVGTKQRNADQQKDINNASSIISSKTEVWTEWEPKSPRLINRLKELEAEKRTKEAALQQANADKHAAKQAAQQAKAEKEAEKARKQAERKAAQERKRKEKEAEKARKQAERKVTQKQKPKKEPKKSDAQPAAEMQEICESITENTVAPYVNDVVSNSDDAERVQQNRRDVDKVKQQLIALRPALDAEKEEPKEKEITEAPAQASETFVPESNITLNDKPTEQPAPITGRPDFKEVADTHYDLDIIEHQINIETSKIAIAQYNIEIEKAKIAREELMIKKLQLLRAQYIQPQQK